MAKKRFNIAVIPGDGIGKEVIPEGLRVLQAAIARFDINLHFDHFDFSSYDYYAKHGEMMPGDWKQKVGNPPFEARIVLPLRPPEYLNCLL